MEREKKGEKRGAGNYQVVISRATIITSFNTSAVKLRYLAIEMVEEEVDLGEALDYLPYVFS